MAAESERAMACGAGLRLPHLAEVAATRPPAAWLEVHPENFVANPHALELLESLAPDYPISVHTVGISVGSAGGIDRAHLARLRDLVRRIEPCLVSGHLAWSTVGATYLNDLLPLPYDEPTLAVVVRHVDEVQECLGRPYLVENPASYLGFGHSTLTEAEFLNELVRRTGCRLLCDVSNIHVSAHNLGYDPYDYLARLPGEAIDEFHLGGFTAEDEGEGDGATLLIDTHAARIAESAWRLYEAAVARFGPRPTLIEWDNDLPSFATLLQEAALAEELAMRALAPESERAVAR